MKLHLRHVAWLLPFLLTACIHKAHQQQADDVLAPTTGTSARPWLSAEPESTPPQSLPSGSTVPSEPVKADTDTKPLPKPPVQHRKPANKTSKPADSSSSAANSETRSINVVGKLSSGDPSGLRRQTVDSMTGTERKLNSIGRTLNSQEQTTGTQIRSFLKQAWEALANGDVDGAHTLAAKAKILLSELGR
jgi:hypothetical protein